MQKCKKEKGLKKTWLRQSIPWNQWSKWLISFFVLLSISTSSFAEIKVSYHNTPVHGLYMFLREIADKDQYSNLNKAYLESPYNTEENQKYIAEFKVLRDYLQSVALGSTKKDDTFYNPITLDQIYLVHSSLSKDLDSFSDRTFNLLSFDQHQKLFAILKNFEPIYKALIWDKVQHNYGLMTDKLKAVVEKNLEKTLNKLITFYDAKWPLNTDYKIAFYPIPGKDLYYARGTFGWQSVGILTERENVEDIYGVVVKIMDGSLWGANREVTKTIEKTFLDNPSKHAKYAWWFFDSALSSAIGSGYAVKQLTGKFDEKDEWFNNKYVNSYAKALYPMVTRYLDENKKMDTAFAMEAIKIYQKTFPDAPREVNHVLLKTFLVVDSDNFETSAVTEAFRREYPEAPYFYLEKGELNHNQLTTKLDASDSTILLVVHKDTLPNKNLLAKVIPNEHQQYIAGLRENSLYSFLNRDGRQYLVLVVGKKEQLPDLLKSLSKDKKFEENRALQLM